MKINFLIIGLGINGGSRAIIELCNRLYEFGHEVNIIYPRFIKIKPLNYDLKSDEYPMLIGSKIFHNIKGLFGIKNIREITPIKCRLLIVPYLSNRYIPDADFTIATWWETCEYLQKLNKNKGHKTYFIQHFETWNNNKERVLKTYEMGFFNIANSNWVKEQIEKNTIGKTDKVILHAPNHDDFYYKKGFRKKLPIRIFALYGSAEWKRPLWVIKACEHLSQEYNIMWKIAGIDEKWSTEDLRNSYNSSHIFCFPSKIEGFGMPPMEAMCCKCAVVSTDVGAVKDYAGDCALISDADDFYAFQANIKKLLDNPKMIDELGEKGYKKMQDYSWGKTARNIEYELLRKVIL